jgi:hypothetical protein
MSAYDEQPQEWWTEQDADGCWHIGTGNRGFADLGDDSDAEATANAIRDAHNAALAAERERHDRAQERAKKWFDLLAAERKEREMFQLSQEAWIADYRKSQEQLQAEREKVKGLADYLEKAAKESEQQLAAERENFAKATKLAAEKLADKHAKELAAEREEYTTTAAELYMRLNELREQLAAACKVSQDSQRALFNCMQQLAALQGGKGQFAQADIDAIRKPLMQQLAAEQQWKWEQAEKVKPLVEALQCAEYAMTHPESNQQFALNAVRDAIGQADALAKAKEEK